MFGDPKNFTYQHKVSDEEKDWVSDVATFFIYALCSKKIDSNSIIHCFSEEFTKFSSVIDSGIVLERTDKEKLYYRPVLNGSFLNKSLCGIKWDDGYYFCESYFFRDKNNIEYNKIIFNDKELEKPLKILFDELIAKGWAEKIKYDPIEYDKSELF